VELSHVDVEGQPRWQKDGRVVDHFPKSTDGPTPLSPTEAQTALTAARAAHDTALAAMTYDQDSIDNVRSLRYQLELASFNYAVAFGVRDPGLVPPLPPQIPGTYPGVFGPLTDPAQIAGCVLHLASDAGVTVDGSNNVSAWADQSGSGHDVTWDLGKYLLVPNGFGSLPGLVNDVSQGTLKTTTQILTAGHARTVFVVAKPHFIDDGCIFVDFQPARTSAAKSLAFGIYNKAGAGTLHPASDLNTIDETLVGAAPSDFGDVSQIFAYRWQGSGHAVEFAKGGAVMAALSGTALTSETGDNGLTIGHGYGAAHHGPMRGSIASVIVYDSKLSDRDYGRVCTYLTGKFGL